jgi:RNA polymerase sigma-70 factor, ECF subfamily
MVTPVPPPASRRARRFPSCRPRTRRPGQPEPGGSALDLDDTPDLLIYARSAAAGLPTSGDQPAAELLDRLGSERVMAALRRLPREYRIVCTLSLMVDLTYEEIARVLEYPVGTVRSRLHRGRKMLQKALWTRAETDGLTGRERRTP